MLAPVLDVQPMRRMIKSTVAANGRQTTPAAIRRQCLSGDDLRIRVSRRITGGHAANTSIRASTAPVLSAATTPNTAAQPHAARTSQVAGIDARGGGAPVGGEPSGGSFTVLAGRPPGSGDGGTALPPYRRRRDLRPAAAMRRNVTSLGLVDGTLDARPDPRAWARNGDPLNPRCPSAPEDVQLNLMTPRALALLLLT